MKKHWKIILAVAVAAVLLAAGTIWLYWEGNVSLQKQLPEETWQDATMIGVVLEGHVIYTVDEQTLPKITAALNETQVSRGPDFETLEGDGLILILYPEDVHSAMHLTIREDGRICIRGFRDADSKRCYYEGGEELYRQLMEIAEDLPATVETAG